jgi:hypothetical protein
MRWLALVLVATLAGGCFWRNGPTLDPPDTSFGVELVDSDAVVGFYERASAFYDRLANRRFNTLATYEDRVLREFFRGEAEYADYYADLADGLTQAHFEKNRPLSLQVKEFLVDGPGRARVKIHIVGNNGLPLRFWSAVLEREDRWERLEGQWWIIPGKL